MIEPHSVWQGSFRLFGVELKCHILSDDQRVIEEESMADLLKAMGSERDDAGGSAPPPEDGSEGSDLEGFVKWMKGSGD